MKIEIPTNVKLSTIVKAFAIVAIGVLLYRGYYWRENVNLRGYHSDLAYGFLADGFKGPDGKLYNRSQVLDALVQNALKQAVAAQQQKAAQPQLVSPELKKK